MHIYKYTQIRVVPGSVSDYVPFFSNEQRNTNLAESEKEINTFLINLLRPLSEQNVSKQKVGHIIHKHF